MKLVIHVGSHKAGSTSIQEFCRDHPARLRTEGIHYPIGLFPGTAWQHSALKDLVLRGEDETIRHLLTAARDDAAGHGAHSVFLSGEDICTLGPGLAHRFQTVARTLFEATRIVLVVRNKRDYLYSSYKHNLLHGPATGEHDFVRRQIFSPARTAAAWRQLRPVTLDVLSFEALKADLLGGFFGRVFGIEVRETIVSNESLDYLSLLVINALAKDAGPGAVAMLMEHAARHRLRYNLAIENVIADNLDRQYPDEDWVIPGFDLGPALLARRPLPTGQADGAMICRRTAELLGVLERYFAEPAAAKALTQNG